jgi:hypothetical protein
LRRGARAGVVAGIAGCAHRWWALSAAGNRATVGFEDDVVAAVAAVQAVLLSLTRRAELAVRPGPIGVEQVGCSVRDQVRRSTPSTVVAVVTEDGVVVVATDDGVGDGAAVDDQLRGEPAVFATSNETVFVVAEARRR